MSSDLCVISPSAYDKITGILQRTLKISPLQVWWTVTHTHLAPEVGPPGLPVAFEGERYTQAFDTAYTALIERADGNPLALIANYAIHGYKRTTKAGAKIIRLPVRFLKINDDVAIWSAPLELFCEVSNEIRDRSPFPYTFYFGYTNGWLGYLLTEEVLQYGGYEPGVSPYTPSAAKDLTEAVMSYLQGKMSE